MAVVYVPIGDPAEVTRIGDVETGGREWELLPGEHEIRVKVKSSTLIEEAAGLQVDRPPLHYHLTVCRIQFSAEAGETYVVSSSGSGRSMRVSLAPDREGAAAVGSADCNRRAQRPVARRSA